MKNNKEKTKERLIRTAGLLLNTPYKYAVKPEEIPKFLDCSSFTQAVFQKTLGIDIGRSTILQATKGVVVSESELQPGDLIFFRGSKGHYNDELFPPDKYGLDMLIGHVAMYIGNGMLIHANGEAGKVVTELLNQVKSSRSRISLIKRILP